MSIPSDKIPPEEEPTNGLPNPQAAGESSFSDEPIRLPEEAPYLPSPRLRSRRRRRAILVRPEMGTRAEFMENMARRAYPNYEFYVFSALCGAVIGFGYLIDAQALLVFAALLAPILTPWVGISLATVTGSGRYFFQSLIGFLVGGFIIFGTAVLAGLGTRIFMPRVLDQAFYHSRLWWPDLFLLITGAILLVASFVRSEDKPYLPSVMLAYELYLPLSAAGFGLGVGQPGLWPDGLLVFGVHLALATLLGVVTFFVLGFRPMTFAGYTLGTTIALIAVIALVAISGIGTAITGQIAMPGLPPTLVPTETLTATLPPASHTPIIANESTSTPTMASTDTPAAPSPSATQTPTLSIPPTETPTTTITPEPTPVYARISVPGDSNAGAIIRAEPGGTAITSVQNGILVQVLPEIQDVDGVIWVRIIALVGDRNIEGWVVQATLATATPSVPNYQPSPTP